MSDAAIGERNADSMFFAEDRPSLNVSGDSFWKILVVDDDAEVHRITKYVLDEKVLVGKPLRLLYAASAQEAEKLLIDNEIACTLLDVVMEKEDSGLRLVKKIRDTMRNSKIRIILRTGQPGRAPEHSIMEQYEINDYREKTELTSQKLITAVTSAIRAYRDLEIIEKSRRSLRMLIDSSANIYGFQPYKKFAYESLRLLDSLLGVGNDSVFTGIADPAGKKDSEFTIIAATGKFAPFIDQNISSVLDEKEVKLIKTSAAGRKTYYGDVGFAMEIDSGKKNQSVLYMRYRSTDKPFERELLDISRANIKSAYTNLSLYNEVQKLAHERGILLREVHHRVKNNLQVISSLIDFEISDQTTNAEKRLLNIRNRIQSIASVHDCVHDAENVETVDFRDVAQSVLDNVLGNEPYAKKIQHETEFESARVSLDKAIPCTLILGEMTLNAFRCAAESHEKSNVTIHTGAKNNRLFIQIKADFTGVAETEGLAKSNSVSDMIVNALVAQLGGEYRFNIGEGMEIDLSVPL